MKNLFKRLCLVLLSTGLFACSGSKSSTSSGAGNPVGTSPSNDNNSTSEPVNRTPQMGGNFLSNFPLNQILSGGVPKDGIPALTDPRFVDITSSEAGYLNDNDLVMGVVIDGEAKAYPHNMGWWHEIVNDVVGGHPIVVSFCPLTGTGMVFDGGDSDNRLTCGVSGLLFNNNLIMYDRRDGATLYPQMIHTAVDGPNLGDLRLIPVIETTWRYWKKLYPTSKVISLNAGLYSPRSPYNQYPYGSYRNPTTPPNFPSFPRLSDNQTALMFPPKTMTLGVRFGEIAKAYPFTTMGTEAVINDTVADQDLVIVFYAQEQLALPFLRRVGNQDLTFSRVSSADNRFPFLLQDAETQSTWNLTGEAISGALQGQKLTQVAAHNAFWFAWATFWQNTGIY